MNKRMCRFFAAVLIASVLSMLVGCTENAETKTKDENIQTLEAVLKNALTGPSDQLKELVKEEGLEELRKYEDALYKDHFANDRSYVSFAGSYASSLMIDPLRNRYQLNVKNMSFDKTTSEEIIYNFTVEVEYQKEGSAQSEVGMVKGQANLNEEHKIEDLLIRTDLWSSGAFSQ